jgi:polyhydroxyalkanoate synthesis regulator phasin
MTPFEIRAQMLEMAQDYLQKQFELNQEFARKTFDELVKNGEKVQSDWQQYMPKMYSFDEVVSKAKELYGFVKDVK